MIKKPHRSLKFFNMNFMSLYRQAVIGGVVALPIIILSSCSWLPEELNVTKYLWGEEDSLIPSENGAILADTADQIIPDDLQVTDDGDLWIQEEDSDFPLLSDQDTRPLREIDTDLFDQAEQELLEEREDAKYTSESLRSRYAERQEQDWSSQEDLIQSTIDTEEVNETSLLESDAQPVESDMLFQSRGEIVNDTTAQEVLYAVQAEQTIDSIETGLPTQIDDFRRSFNDKFSESGALSLSSSDADLVSSIQKNNIPLDTTQLLDMHRSQIFENAHSSVSEMNQSNSNVSFLALTVNFGTGSSSISSIDRKKLREVVNSFKSYNANIKVIGHASKRTKDMGLQEREKINLNISVDRAKAVASLLSKFGIPKERLDVVAMSDKQPIAEEYMPSGEKENQRVEIYINY